MQDKNCFADPGTAQRTGLKYLLISEPHRKDNWSGIIAPFVCASEQQSGTTYKPAGKTFAPQRIIGEWIPASDWWSYDETGHIEIRTKIKTPQRGAQRKYRHVDPVQVLNSLVITRLKQSCAGEYQAGTVIDLFGLALTKPAVRINFD
jgi:hypothetical protein